MARRTCACAAKAERRSWRWRIAAPAASLEFAISPNPSRARTTLRYALPRAGVVTAELFDASGRRVRTLRLMQASEAAS